MNPTTSTSTNEQFNEQNFWKSQSMDSLNQLLSGCHNMNATLASITPDVKIDTNYPVGASISSSLSFSSVLPSLSGNNGSANGFATIQQSVSQNTSQQTNQQPPSNSPSVTITNVTTETLTSITPITSSTSQQSTQSSVSSMLVNFHPHQMISYQPKEVVKVEKEPNYVDVTPYLILPQHEAARRLGVPCSTLSKRWKEASVNRKWPFRIVCKLDKEITTLLKNVENNANTQSTPLSPAIEESLGSLLKRRQEELRTVVIRIN